MRQPTPLIAAPYGFDSDVIRYGPDDEPWPVPLGIPFIQLPDVDVDGLVVFRLGIPEHGYNQHMLFYSMNVDQSSPKIKAVIGRVASHSKTAGYPAFLVEYLDGSQSIYLVEDVGG